jgi:hypothetical protein
MNQNQKDTFVKKMLGLAMILVGIFLVVVQRGRGAAPTLHAQQTATASVQTASEMPRLENAKVETRTVAGGLEATLQDVLAQTTQPQWVGYGVEGLPGKHNACCGNYGDNGDCGTCQLEKGYSNSKRSKSTSPIARLEGPRQLFVLIRLENKKVQRIQVASENCTLDAGGLPFLWLTGVTSNESLAWLGTLVHNGDLKEHGDHGPGQGALTAIALHAGPAADRALETFVAADQHEELRKQAAFWIGAARGKAGLDSLKRLAKTDSSQEVRAQVAFAFFVSEENGAVDEIIRMAHDDNSAHVRGQALFWLAQKAGQRASAAITGAIESDPDTEVKTKAVFALSQLPKVEGVPRLILVAETNKNPEVRKQAMFWLGQSEDPRAIAFFEKVLSR